MTTLKKLKEIKERKKDTLYISLIETETLQGSITLSSNRTNRDNPPKINPIKEIVVGSTLGDGSLQKLKNGGVKFSFVQSHIHRIYLFHMFLQFYDFCKKWPTLRCAFDHRYNKYYYSWSFTTEPIPELYNIYTKLYGEDGKKRIPSNIIDYLTPLSLAHWIMDDGGKQKNGGLKLNTNSFKVSEVELLSSSLNTKYGIRSKLYIKKKSNIGGAPYYPIIYIPKYDYLDRIVPLIKEHFVDTMYYKLGE